MNITNTSLQIRHIGGVVLLPGETKSLPPEVTSNEKLMRHVMKDVDAKLLEVGEPSEEAKDDSKKQSQGGRAAGGKPTEQK
jgi:hypothetical protein